VELVRALGRHGISTPLIHASTANAVLAPDRPIGEELGTVVVTDELVYANEAVTGEIPSVPWAREASFLLVAGSVHGTLLVDLRDPKVTVTEGANLADEPLDAVSLRGVRAARLARTLPAVDVRSRLGLLRAAALAGVVEGALTLSRDYVREREQFGAPLIQIPAVASSLAMMRARLSQVEAALHRATQELGHGGDAAATAVAIARVIAGTAATEVAEHAHQLHGAVGMTVEYPLHRFTRRLWAWRDAETPEEGWAIDLGRRASAGEAAVWESMTAAGADGGRRV
jgi:acyl-CoA dehydrogenase